MSWYFALWRANLQVIGCVDGSEPVMEIAARWIVGASVCHHE